MRAHAPPEQNGPGPLAGGTEAGDVTDVTRKLPLITRWRNAVCARTSTLPSTQRLVALAMSLYSNTDGRRCYPSEEALAAATALTTRSVRTALAGIEQAGFATRQKIKGKGQAWRWTLWTLSMPEGAEPHSLPRRKGAETGSAPLAEGAETDDSKVRKLVPKGEERRSADLERAPRKRHLEVKAISRSADGRLAERFDEFWSAYPRKEGSKDKARKSWANQKLDVKGEQIIAAVTERTRSDPTWQTRTYIPHPVTYLNQKRWEDEWKQEIVKPSARDSFVGKTYAGTPIDQLPPELRAGFELAVQDTGESESREATHDH